MAVIDLLTLGELPVAADPRWSDWLTPQEITSCLALGHAEEHLAARLAGKRALARELGLLWPPRWQDLEIGYAPHHPPPVTLHGTADAAAVSLTHAAGYVAALAWSGGPW